MHYYDVDYAHNYLTGKGHDNTKEISKEEFYGDGEKTATGHRKNETEDIDGTDPMANRDESKEAIPE